MQPKNWIQQPLLRWKAKHQALRHRPTFPPCQTPLRIIFLYSYTTLAIHQALRSLRKELQARGHTVHLLTYLAQPSIDFPAGEAELIRPSSFSLLGKLHPMDLPSWWQTPHDLLYTFDAQLSPPIQYLTAYAPAQCKIGYDHPIHTPLLDILIRPINAEPLSPEKLLHYSQCLQ